VVLEADDTPVCRIAAHPRRLARNQHAVDALECFATMAVRVHANLVAILATEDLPYRHPILLPERVEQRGFDPTVRVGSHAR
jgi:hypothetical protein